MLSVPRFVAWLNGLLLVLLLASCAKEEARPTAGALEASILPAGAALMAIATAADGRVYQVAPDTATGRFRLAGLPAGSYQLTFITIRTYVPPARPVRLTIAAGQTATPALDPLERSTCVQGTLSWVLDGVRYETTQLAEGRVAEYGGIYLRTVITTPTADHMLSLSIWGRAYGGAFGGVGTYQLGVQYGTNPNAFCRANYWQYYPDRSFWHCGMPDEPVAPANSPGTITVTRFDEQARRFTGTFAFTAMRRDFNNNPGPASVTVSQGRFDLSF